MVSLKLQKRLAATVLKCGKGRVSILNKWLRVKDGRQEFNCVEQYEADRDCVLLLHSTLALFCDSTCSNVACLMPISCSRTGLCPIAPPSDNTIIPKTNL